MVLAHSDLVTTLLFLGFLRDERLQVPPPDALLSLTGSELLLMPPPDALLSIKRSELLLEDVGTSIDSSRGRFGSFLLCLFAFFCAGFCRCGDSSTSAKMG
jgi:hypothetical protein